MEISLVCYACSKLITVEDRVGRQETCPECNAYLHCCLNCRFFDASAYNECREPVAERVVDKEVANFCDYFEASSEKSAADESQEKAKTGLEGLFKKK